MSDPYESLEPAEDPEIPDWENEYIDQVSDRLLFNYDLEKDRDIRGEEFTLYGEMQMSAEKHFFHPAIRFGYHESREHVFVTELPAVSQQDLDHFVDLGHDLANGWIDADEEHFSTEFTFVLLVDDIPSDVGEYVREFRDRTLIKYGYYGHYEIHLIVVNPTAEQLVASQEAGVQEAFRLWEPIEHEEPGLFELITRRLQL